MKKFLCAILLIIPGIAFFMDDFGAATVWLRIFGICLMLVVVADYVFKKNLIVPVCKFVYCIIYVPWTLYKKRKERKRKESLERSRRFWNGFHWYW